MSTTLIFPGFEKPTERRPKPPKNYEKFKKAESAFIEMPQMVSWNPGYYTIYNDTSVMRRLGRITGMRVERKLNPGTLSRAAASRMKRAMEYLMLISQEKKYRVKERVDKNGKLRAEYIDSCFQTFVTLTLSSKQKHSDNWIKRNMLKNFVDAVRKRLPGISYVWRAEVQPGTGNIHFHFVTDHFIPYPYLNFIWNRIQFHYGYLNDYIEKKGHTNAPSANIEKVQDKAAVRRYMRKYMVKYAIPRAKKEIQSDIAQAQLDLSVEMNFHKRKRLKKELERFEDELKHSGLRKIEGKLWGCSDNLLCRPFSLQTAEMSMDLRKEMQDSKILLHELYFTVFGQDSEYFFDMIDSLPDYLRAQFVNHYAGKNGIFHEKVPPNIIFCATEMYSYN